MAGTLQCWYMDFKIVIMKVYIATPVNARKEETLEEKRQKAFERVQHIEDILKEKLEERYKVFRVDCHSSFDEDMQDIVGEANIMGRCVQKVMECDSILLDYGWANSNGCQLENQAAEIYGKTRWFAPEFGIEQEKKYLTDEETAAIRNCFVCKHCLPPFYRENGKMCNLEKCSFKEA